MSAYDTILEAIEDKDKIPSWAIQAKYVGDVATDPVRKFLAYVLGTSLDDTGGNQHVVLGFQYEGKNTPPFPPSRKNWRCFKVDSFDPTTVSKIPFAPSPPFVPPPPLKFRQLKKQSCVEDVEAWRQKKYKA